MLFGDDSWLQSLYNQLLPMLESHILKNSGTRQDAKDVFQEAMIITYKKACDPAFELTSAIETFIFSVGKRKWLYELKKRKNRAELMEVSEDMDDTIDQMIISNEKQSLYLKYFNQLSTGCRDILQLFFNGLKMSEIASKLDLASEGYARKRKHACQEKLIAMIKEDSIYQELRDE